MEDTRQELVALLPQLRGFARSLACGDSQLADDLVHDTVVLALRAWHSFAPGTSLRSWLLKILHNRFHSLKRRKHLSSEVARDDLESLSSVPPSQLAGVEVAAFKRAFAMLKPEHRAVLVLTAVHGLSYEAIAEVCGCQVGTVKSRISRARRHLKEILVSDGEQLAPSTTSGVAGPAEIVELRRAPARTKPVGQARKLRLPLRLAG